MERAGYLAMGQERHPREMKAAVLDAGKEENLKGEYLTWQSRRTINTLVLQRGGPAKLALVPETGALPHMSYKTRCRSTVPER